ncbi:hypothetical protein [Kribbella sp. NPDC004875]|uniref:hypothetical protein n=1 Tax=Kribbella sp. NPDC004875 TaxID=3364107 RepID=UPI003683B5A7
MTTATIAPSPPVPASAAELLARSGEIARDLAGAEHSAWNGQIAEAPAGVLGLAHWDGTLYLDRESILDPLHHLYEHAGEDHAIPTLARYREALATLLHEHAHFLGPSGSTQESAREAFLKPGSRELEEGVTEAWAQDHLDEYIHRLGIDRVAPGINSVQAPGYYAAFVPAVRKLSADLENRNGLRRGEVLDLLNRQTADGQFPLLVDLVYNSTRLPDLELPPGVMTRSRLENTLRSGLAHLDAYELTAPSFATAKSLSTADHILDHLNHEIRTAESASLFTPTSTALAVSSSTGHALPPTRHAPTPTHQIPPPHHAALTGIAPPTAPRPANTHLRPAHTSPRLTRGGLHRPAQ